MPLFDSLIKPALDSVTGLVSEFHLSPEDKLKFQAAAAELAAKTQQASFDYDARLNDIAGQNIRAEAQCEDKFSERARPSFMYLVMAVLAANYIMIPFCQIFGSKVQPVFLPGEVLTLFGVCITGYVFNRTVERVASLPGDSQISILGMKVGNKQ